MQPLKLSTAGALITFCLLLAVAGGCKKEYVHVGANWDSINKLQKPENTFAVQVAGSESAKIGDPLRYTVTSAKNGKLWVVQVDPKDELTLLFPNKKGQENTIKADQPLTIPPAGSTWSIEASEPKGASVVAFVVTTGEIDIDDVIKNDQSMAKAIRIVEKDASWGFAKKVVEIK